MATLPQHKPSVPLRPLPEQFLFTRKREQDQQIPFLFLFSFQVLDDPDPFVLKSAITAVSVLTRVLPFILEAYTDPETGEVDPALHSMFWSTEEEPPSTAATATGDGAGAGAGAGAGEQQQQPDARVALGSAMVSATMRLLFTRQLTVDVYSSCESVDAGVVMLPVFCRWSCVRACSLPFV